MSDRKPVFDGAPTVSVGYNAHLGAWTAIYAQPLSNDVVIRTAPALMGAWSPPKLLLTAAKKTGGGAYDANWHREYDQDGGKTIYVTFSRPTGVGWFGAEFALVRVGLP